MGNPAAVQDPANASTTTSHESCPAGKEASSPTKRDEEVSKLVEVILHRPFNRAITHHRIRRPSPFGLHVATLCRLTTLAALVYSAVQSAILLVDTFDLLRDWQYSDTKSPKAFDIVYFVTLMLLLLSAFLAIFGIIFYRAYLTVPFILCGLCAFVLLSGLLNYSLFQPPDRFYSTFTTTFPDYRMNALFDIIVLGVSVYITLCNVREQVLYDLPSTRLESALKGLENLSKIKLTS